MCRRIAAAIVLVIGCVFLLSGCDQTAAQPDGDSEEERCLDPSETPTATPEETIDQTATPTEEPEPTATPTPVPPDTPTPLPPTPTVAVVTDWSVIYHDAVTFCMDSGTYNPGITPWMDVLVRLGETWYGPDRYSGDAVQPLPLPEDYSWVCTGAFSCLRNGEAWLSGSGEKAPPACSETVYTGKAQLFGPGGGFVKEIELRVTVVSN
jgi:hypothetical protein